MVPRSTIYTATAAAVVLAVVLFGLLFKIGRNSTKGEKQDRFAQSEERAPTRAKKASVRTASDSAGASSPFSGFADSVMRMMLAGLQNNDTAIPREAVLTFNSDDAYLKFLASMGNRRLRLLGSSEQLRSVRIGFDSYSDFSAELANMDPEDQDAGLNFLVSIPLPPDTGESPGAGAGAVPFGREALASLGISGDTSAWGEGVTVAVLDSGVQDHPVFAAKTVREFDLVVDSEGNPVPIDLNNGHGTAVASIIGAADERLPGVAPAAELLSYRILDNEGVTNSFTLAEAIVSATDAGAEIINVSLGSSGDAGVVRQAVAYAQENGALIVASAGNEGTGYLSYPAAIEGVVAVGSNDARGEILDFSNSGTNLAEGGLVAPGLGVTAAWPDEQIYEFSGTSASAPYVSGSVAAVMSENPGISAQTAYELLLATSNEAGAPGADVNYGFGRLDVGRAMESGTSGVVDVGVASYYYDPALAAVGGTENTAHVVIENRGTDAVHNVSVDINTDGRVQTRNISYIPAGEIVVIDTPINAHAGATEGSLQVSASATLSSGVNSADRDTSDNSLQRTIDWPSAATLSEETEPRFP